MSSGFLEATGFAANVSAASVVVPLPRTRRKTIGTIGALTPCPAGESLLEMAFESAGMLGRFLNGRRTVKCPWEYLHTTGTSFDGSTILFAPIQGSDIGLFHCSHSHCSERALDDVIHALPHEAVSSANERVHQRRATRLPPMGPGWSAAQTLSRSAAATTQTSVETSPASRDRNPTDVGNAQRLVDRRGSELRYCFVWKRWLVWNGRFWETDERGSIELMAKETVAQLLAEAVSCSSEADRKAHVAHGLKSEDVRRIAGMVSLARSEPGIPVAPDELDTHDWLFNVENGTLDLRTGRLLPHHRQHLLTKQAPVIFDSAAKHPTWDAFLDEILPNKPDLLRFIQKALGYALTGDTSAQVIVFFFGCGANGKTTLLETVSRICGSYSTQAPPNLLLEKKHDGHPTELADLFGRRLVTTSEVDQGRKLSEALVKQLTGGDRIKGRFMHKDFFDFRPTHKLFLAANHKPVIHGCDEGIWRRIRLVPFDIIIEKNKRDTGLMQKLWAERSGILNWLLEGCLAYQREGLAPPEEVQAATDAYRSEMDRIGGFLGDECVMAAGARGKAQQLYDRYVHWCGVNAREPVSTKTFGSMLREKGFQPTKMHGLSGWEGLRLKSDAERIEQTKKGRGGSGEDGERNPSDAPRANQSELKETHPHPPPLTSPLSLFDSFHLKPPD